MFYRVAKFVRLPSWVGIVPFKLFELSRLFDLIVQDKAIYYFRIIIIIIILFKFWGKKNYKVFKFVRLPSCVGINPVNWLTWRSLFEFDC